MTPQRTEEGSLYREAWPSLFLGPKGSRCALHVDTCGLHFWMLVFEGAPNPSPITLIPPLPLILPLPLPLILALTLTLIHFWMPVFEGTKRWTIFPPHASPLLRPTYRHGHDPVFDADPHAPHAPHAPHVAEGSGGAEGSAAEGSGAAEGQPPLLRYLDRWEVTLGPGELLFVPAGAAHAVTNLSHTAAISANFVDSTNLDLFREELSVAACSK